MEKKDTTFLTILDKEEIFIVAYFFTHLTCYSNPNNIYPLAKLSG